MNDLDKAREEINSIDEELMHLFEKRMQSVKKVIAYKNANKLPILDTNREKEVINKNLSFIEDSKLVPYAQDFLMSLMRISKEYQNRG